MLAQTKRSRQEHDSKEGYIVISGFSSSPRAIFFFVLPLLGRFPASPRPSLSGFFELFSNSGFFELLCWIETLARSSETSTHDPPIYPFPFRSPDDSSPPQPPLASSTEPSGPRGAPSDSATEAAAVQAQRPLRARRPRSQPRLRLPLPGLP